MMNKKKSSEVKDGSELIDNITELDKKGILFQIERKVLHPHGYTFAYTVDKNGDKVNIVGMYKTDQPEGFEFKKKDLRKGVEKVKKYMAKSGREKIEMRKKILNYKIQGKKNE